MGMISLICCNNNLSDLVKAITHTEIKGHPLLKYTTYITYHFIERLECRLLIIMVDTSISMQNRDTFFFSTFTVTSVHTVVRSVVPLTWKDIEALYQCQSDAVRRKNTKDILNEWQVKPCFCGKVGTDGQGRKKENMQLLLLQRSKAATRQNIFLSCEDGYTCLSTVQLQLTKREGNAKTGVQTQIKSSPYEVKNNNQI